MQLAPIEPVQVVVECGSLERAHSLRPAAVTEGAVTPAANSTADMFADKSATLAATVEPASTSVSTTSVVSCERDVTIRLDAASDGTAYPAGTSARMDAGSGSPPNPVARSWVKLARLSSADRSAAASMPTWTSAVA